MDEYMEEIVNDIISHVLDEKVLIGESFVENFYRRKVFQSQAQRSYDLKINKEGGGYEVSKNLPQGSVLIPLLF